MTASFSSLLEKNVNANIYNDSANTGTLATMKGRASKLFLGLIALAVFMFGASTEARAETYECLDEIPDMLDSYSIEITSIEICDGLFPGISIEMRDFIELGSRPSRNGSGLRLLFFRLPNFTFRAGNFLSVVLVPRTEELWDVEFMDLREGREFLEPDARVHYVVWSARQRGTSVGQRSFSLNENSMRVFTCAHNGGCYTWYEAVMCEDFEYPNAPRPFSDLPPWEGAINILVTAHRKDAADAMLGQYSEMEAFIDAALNTILDYSCNT